MTLRHTYNKRWLSDRRDKYPFWVEIPNGLVRPEDVPGDHASAGLRRGFRMYAFQTEQEANAFKEKYQR